MKILNIIKALPYLSHLTDHFPKFAKVRPTTLTPWAEIHNSYNL